MQYIKIKSNIDGLTMYSNYDERFAGHRKALRNFYIKKYAVLALSLIVFVAGFLYSAHLDQQFLQAGLIH